MMPLEILRPNDRLHGTRGKAPGLAVSALSMIMSGISSSGRCASAPCALETMILPLCASLCCLYVGKSSTPCETGCAEAVRHSDAVEREAVRLEKLTQGWGPADKCCYRLSYCSSTSTGQGHLCGSLLLRSIPLAEKGLPRSLSLLSARKITGTLFRFWICGWRYPRGVYPALLSVY